VAHPLRGDLVLPRGADRRRRDTGGNIGVLPLPHAAAWPARPMPRSAPPVAHRACRVSIVLPSRARCSAPCPTPRAPARRRRPARLPLSAVAGAV